MHVRSFTAVILYSSFAGIVIFCTTYVISNVGAVEIVSLMEKYVVHLQPGQLLSAVMHFCDCEIYGS